MTIRQMEYIVAVDLVPKLFLEMQRDCPENG